jgi:hypothetical protein
MDIVEVDDRSLSNTMRFVTWGMYLNIVDVKMFFSLWNVFEREE